uniref:Uncharacterized protein n=1 Tax=Anguilla anguilla TaxID=7936 RepID=A0A0E9RTT7_ANGAN
MPRTDFCVITSIGILVTFVELVGWLCLPLKCTLFHRQFILSVV